MLAKINLPVMCKHFRYTREEYGCAKFGTCPHTDDWKQCSAFIPVARAKVDEKGKAVVPICPHRGEPTGDTVICKTCNRGSGTQLMTYACSLHGRCTIDPKRPVQDVHCCDAGKIQ